MYGKKTRKKLWKKKCNLPTCFRPGFLGLPAWNHVLNVLFTARRSGSFALTAQTLTVPVRTFYQITSRRQFDVGGIWTTFICRNTKKNSNIRINMFYFQIQSWQRLSISTFKTVRAVTVGLQVYNYLLQTDNDIFHWAC